MSDFMNCEAPMIVTAVEIMLIVAVACSGCAIKYPSCGSWRPASTEAYDLRTHKQVTECRDCLDGVHILQECR